MVNCMALARFLHSAELPAGTTLCGAFLGRGIQHECSGMSQHVCKNVSLSLAKLRELVNSPRLCNGASVTHTLAFCDEQLCAASQHICIAGTLYIATSSAAALGDKRSRAKEREHAKERKQQCPGKPRPSAASRRRPPRRTSRTRRPRRKPPRTP